MDASATPDSPTLGGALIIDNDPDARSLIASFLPDGVRPLPGPIGDLREVCRTGRTGVVVLGPSFAAPERLQDIAALDLPSRGLLGVLVADRPDETLLRSAMQAGLRDVVPLAEGVALLGDVVERLGAISRSNSGESATRGQIGRVTAIAAAKGGVGSTTVTVNLAAELARQGLGVVVIDADVQFGDVALHLGLRPTTSIATAVELGTKLSPRRLESLLIAEPDSGIRVLAAPPDPVAGDLVSAADIAFLIETACHLADVVLVDTASGMNALTLSVLELADRIGLVTAASVGSLRGSMAELNVLASLHLAAKTHLIVNRVDADHHVGKRRLAHWSHIPVAGYLPESRDVALAENHTTFALRTAPRSKFAAAIGELADSLLPEPSRTVLAGSSR